MRKIAGKTGEKGISTLELTMAMPLVVFAMLILIGLGHTLISKQHAVVGGQFAAHHQRVREAAPSAAAFDRGVSGGAETFSLSGGGDETLSYTASAIPRKGLIAQTYPLTAATSQYQTPRITNACVPRCTPFDAFTKILRPELLTGMIFSGNSGGLSQDGLLAIVAGKGKKNRRQIPPGAVPNSPGNVTSELGMGPPPAASDGGGREPPRKPPGRSVGAGGTDDEKPGGNGNNNDNNGNAGKGNDGPSPDPRGTPPPPKPRPTPRPTPTPERPKEPEKPARDLISGSLKRSPSYHSELEDFTKQELEKMARGKGNLARNAKQMLKLIKEGERLRNKGNKK
jgi:hypothetical protein